MDYCRSRALSAIGRTLSPGGPGSYKLPGSHGVNMHQPPHARDLRKGRYSQPGQIYLITTVTRDRQPVFVNLHAARILIRALREEQNLGRADTLAFVVMPDHLHWLMTLDEDAALSGVVRALKAITAKKLGGALWQRGFHDHALRREEDL